MIKDFSFLGLLLFVIFILSACNEPTPIGDDFIDDNDLNFTNFTDTLTLEISLVRKDSLHIYRDDAGEFSEGTIIGSLQDPVFGRSQGNAYIQPSPAFSKLVPSGVDIARDTTFVITENPDDPDDPIIDTIVVSWVSPEDFLEFDSLVLSLDYFGSNAFYGDSLMQTLQTFNLYEIIEDLPEYDNSEDYYAASVNFMTGQLYDTYQKKFDPDLPFYELDTLTVNDSLTIDSTQFNPQIRFRLPDNIGENILNEFADSNGVFDDSDTFREFFKGLYLESDPNNTATTVVNLTNSYLQLYYTANDIDGSLTTTTSQSLTLPIVNQPYARQYKHDYTGTPIEEILNENNGIITDIGYLQGMSGLDLNIKIPHLNNLGDIIVNKAELVVTAYEDLETQDTIYTPPPFVYTELVSGDDLNVDRLSSNTIVTDADTTTAVTKFTYTIKENFSLQNLAVNGNNNSIKIFVGESHIIPNRLIFQGTESDIDPIKLNLYYTPIE